MYIKIKIQAQIWLDSKSQAKIENFNWRTMPQYESYTVKCAEIISAVIISIWFIWKGMTNISNYQCTIGIRKTCPKPYLLMCKIVYVMAILILTPMECLSGSTRSGMIIATICSLLIEAVQPLLHATFQKVRAIAIDVATFWYPPL